MPFYRKVSTRFIHPLLFSLIVGRKITDSTNGFRAVRLSLLDDPRIDINQDWLDNSHIYWRTYQHKIWKWVES